MFFIFEHRVTESQSFLCIFRKLNLWSLWLCVQYQITVMPCGVIRDAADCRRCIHLIIYDFSLFYNRHSHLEIISFVLVDI